MPEYAEKPLTIVERRRARRLAYWNGAVWSIGNGLASTTLVVYLAGELGAEKIGLGIGLILAARHLVGVLRLGAPVVIGRWVDRKWFCIASFFLSTLLLMALPLVAAPGRLPSAEASLAALVVLWCLYHLMQYLATVALWSWLADLVPLRIRGCFLGHRERWMVAGGACAMVASGLFTYWWQETRASPDRWIGYAISAGVGTLFMLAALVPLCKIPRVATSWIARHGASLSNVLAPFFDRRFLSLLMFGCWFSFFNGVTQSVQFIYPKEMLGISLLAMLALQTGMRLGQLSVSPSLGRLADRVGNRPVMMFSLLLVAQGPLFYFFSTPGQPWWFAGAWVVWIAYAGLNVCLPNLMLKNSPAQTNTPFIATYFTVTGLCYAAGTILGGAMLDRLGDETFTWLGHARLDFYQYSFLFGWITRSLGVLVLLLVIEGRENAGKRAGN